MTNYTLSTTGVPNQFVLIAQGFKYKITLFETVVGESWVWSACIDVTMHNHTVRETLLQTYAKRINAMAACVNLILKTTVAPNQLAQYLN